MATTKSTTKTTTKSPRKTTRSSSTTRKSTAASTSTTSSDTKSSTRFPRFDLTKFDLSKVDFSKLPKIEMPKIEMPKMEMPKMEMPKVDADRVANAAKDAAYIGVGVAVLAFQKLQAARRDAGKSFSDQVGNGRAQIEELVESLDARFGGLEGKFDAAVEGLGKRLPDQAGAAFEKAHEATKAARRQVRQAVYTAV